MSKKKKSVEEMLEEALVPGEEQPYVAPDNWVWIKLKGIGSVKGGKRLPKGHSLLDEQTLYPYRRVTDFKSGTIDTDNIKFISSETASKIERYIINKDDVYISIAGTIGRTGIIPESLDGANLTENAAKITDIRGTDNTFIYLALNTEVLQTQIRESIVSSSQPKLALFRIEELKIPLPPINEQKRIAEKVVRLLGKIEEAKQLIEEAKETFELRRAAILIKAFQGDLTSRWREENDLKFDWKNVKLGELVKEGPQNGLYKPQGAYGNGVLIVRIDNFYNGKINEWKTLKRLTLNEDETNIYGLSNNDLIINRVNSIDYLGKSALVRNLEEPCVFESNVMRLRTSEIVDPEYLVLYLNSNKGLQELRKNAKHAVNQASINQQDVKNAIVPLPSIDEQLEIVAILKRLLEREQDATKLIDLNSKLNILRSSILSRAFGGKLGTNDPTEENVMGLLKEIESK
jgi:type I restriction enzyme, S subunit